MAEKKRLLQILDLIKILPRNNCKECGFTTCMAFATHVLREGAKPELCPYWQPQDLAFIKKSLKDQGNDSAYPDHLFSARKFVQGKIKDYDFSQVVDRIGVGLESLPDGEGSCLIINLLEQHFRVTKYEIKSLENVEHDLWDHVLLYNYVAENGGRPLIGEWVPMESLPGSLAKRKVFVTGCEEKIAAAYSGNPERLRASLKVLKADFFTIDSNAEVAAVFYPLPKIPFQILFWDAAIEDGFPAQVKILFDATVLDYLDIESLVFLGEKCAERLSKLA